MPLAQLETQGMSFCFVVSSTVRNLCMLWHCGLMWAYFSHSSMIVLEMKQWKMSIHHIWTDVWDIYTDTLMPVVNLSKTPANQSWTQYIRSTHNAMFSLVKFATVFMLADMVILILKYSTLKNETWEWFCIFNYTHTVYSLNKKKKCFFGVAHWEIDNTCH